MGYISIVFILIIIFLAARLVFLRVQINRMSKDLQEFNLGVTGKNLTVTMLHKPLESLCQHINYGIKIQEKGLIDAENHEAILRAQISNISHDLRTPLTTILGYLNMAKDKPEKVADYLKIIESRSKALLTLIEQFYELSVIDDNKTELVLAPVDINAKLTNCLFENYELFQKKGIEPEYCIPEKCIMVISNAQVLERIFQNLIQNSLKFAKHGISISLEDKSTFCRFTISNDAENLIDADVEHLFERFYTADKSRTVGNTGLGLYIVKLLLEKTQGSLDVVNLENGWFTLEIIFTKAC